MDPHRPVCEIANAKKRMLKHTNNHFRNAKCNMAYLKHVGGARTEDLACFGICTIK